MKFILLFLGIIPGLALCQTTFTERVIDTSTATVGISSIITADFNKDGFQDVATSHYSSNEIAIYLKTGQLGYGTRNLVSSTPQYPQDLAAIDVDADGWTDLVSFSLQDQRLAWFRNQNGTFGNMQLIDSGYVFPVAVEAADFNQDSYTDLVALDDTAVTYYQNDGQGNFSISKLAGKTEFYSIGIGDINGDSLPDVLLGSTLLYTYINNGNGTFARDTRNEALINLFIFEIEMADIDGDGDTDAAIYYSNSNSNIDWYENDGSGKFSPGGSITTSANDVKSMRLADLNKDGSFDFLTAYGQSGELVWMENDGQGNFSTEKVIHTYPALLRQVAATDADADGDVDIFCGHNHRGLFFWENLSPIASLSEAPKRVEVFPNPAQEYFFIQAAAPCKLHVYTADGQMVDERNLEAGVNKLPVTARSGTYILHWGEGQERFSATLVIK